MFIPQILAQILAEPGKDLRSGGRVPQRLHCFRGFPPNISVAAAQNSNVIGSSLSSITDAANTVTFNVGSGSLSDWGIGIVGSNVSSAKLSDVTQAANDAVLNIGSGTAQLGVHPFRSSFSGAATAVTDATDDAVLNIGSGAPISANFHVSQLPNPAHFEYQQGGVKPCN